MLPLHQMQWNVFQKIIFLYQSAAQNFILCPGGLGPSMFVGGWSTPNIQYEWKIGLSWQWLEVESGGILWIHDW